MDISHHLDRIIASVSSGNYSSRINNADLTSEEQGYGQKINLLLDVLEDKAGSIEANVQEMTSFRHFFSILQKEMDLITEGNIQASDEEVPPFHDTQTREACFKLKKTIEQIKASLSGLKTGSKLIHDQIVAGTGSSEISPDSYHGVFREIISYCIQSRDHIFNSLHAALDVLDKYSEYKYSARTVTVTTGKGDWTRLYDAINRIGDNILSLFEVMNSQLGELSRFAGDAAAHVKEVATGSEQVAGNSRAVSENTERSNAGVHQVLRAMEDLAVTVGAVSQKADSVSRLAHESNSLAQEGSEYARKAESGMVVITDSADAVDQLISEIQGEMKKITEIVRLITDIANQTNLLALNAAIEAARAGEMGRGFAVVASEVKSLALESRKSAENVTEMITNLQKKTQNAAEGVSSATTAVKSGSVMLSDTLEIFTRMVGSVEEISSHIEQVASMNQEQAAAVEEIASSMHEVSAMLKDTAQEAVKSASATKETSVSVNQLSEIVENLTRISVKASETLTPFRG